MLCSTATTKRRRVRCAALTVVLLLVPGVATVGAQPTFSKSFTPATIGPGSVSTLTFDVANPDPTPVTDLAFTDVLPAGVVIATPANASTDCDAVLAAPAGGTTITFTDGRLGASGSCVVVVDVTSATPGVHMNVSGDLTSSAGNSGAATDDLTVDTARPGFTKTFTPSSIPLGDAATLVLTIDNTLNAGPAFNLAFSDALPAGLTVASPSNAATACGGVVTANPGATTVSLVVGSVAAGASCTVTADVVASVAGVLGNTTGGLTSTLGSSGKAGAELEVRVDFLRKLFIDDPVPPGATATLEITVTNLDRFDAATDIAFTDDLDAALAGLTVLGLPLVDPCGAGSSLSGTSLLTFTNGTLPPEGSCTFTVTVQVPGGAAPGTYVNTTSAVTFDRGGPTMADPASDELIVAPVPQLTKTYTDDPVAAGGTVTVEYDVTNPSLTSVATDVAFTDGLTALILGLTAPALPASDVCGAGSSFAVVAVGSGVFALSLTGGSLGPAASCTFSTVLQVPAGTPGGTYANPTSAVTATVDAATVTGNSAIDDLVVAAAPRLTKAFLDDPVLPGGTVTLQLSLSHGESAPGAATDVAFVDDLDAALSGLVAIGLPLSDVCGAGSQIGGTSILSFTGGTLAPGAACTFDVTLAVPLGAAAGSHVNTTSPVLATVVGLETTADAASDTLDVTGLSLRKIFTDDPVVPGGTVTLELTITNLDSAAGATAIAFTDDLDATLSGLVAVGLPANDVCGAGSQISGTDLLTFTGGSLAPDSSCTFSVTLQVPGGAEGGEYPNATSTMTADVGGSPVTVDPGADTLIVSSDLLLLTKEFTDDPVAPGASATLELTVTNLSASAAVTDIAFTDDLDAALSGLAAVGLPASDVCGAGSQISGTSLLTFTGGSLAPGASCGFDVTVAVPAGTPATTTVTNTTSQATGMMGGLAVSGLPASDQLRIDQLAFVKAFVGMAAAGGLATLTFTIENLAEAVTGLAFSDDLDAVLSGLIATGLPATDVCGPGSAISGTSFLTFTGGSLDASASCSFDVTLAVPAAAPLGSVVNTTSDLFASGLQVATPATATLEIVPGDAHYVWYSVGTPRRDADRNRIPGRNRLPGSWVITIDDVLIDDVAADDPENFRAKRTLGLLSPAEKNAEGVPAFPDRYYVRYDLLSGKESVAPAENGRFPRPERHQNRVWQLENQLGTVDVETTRVRALLVPAAVDPSAPPAVPPDATHYVCYAAKARRVASDQTPDGRRRRDLQAFTRDAFDDCAFDREGNPSFAGSQVPGTCLVDLKWRLELCNPIDKTAVEPPRTTSAVIDESTARTTSSLLCYRARLASRVRSATAATLAGIPEGERLRPRQSRHQRRKVSTGSALHVTPGNRFPNPRLVETRRFESVCLPTDVLAVELK